MLSYKKKRGKQWGARRVWSGGVYVNIKHVIWCQVYLGSYLFYDPGRTDTLNTETTGVSLFAPTCIMPSFSVFSFNKPQTHACRTIQKGGGGAHCPRLDAAACGLAALQASQACVYTYTYIYIYIYMYIYIYIHLHLCVMYVLPGQAKALASVRARIHCVEQAILDS